MISDDRGDVMIDTRYKYVLTLLILPLLFGCISTNNSSDEYLTPQVVSISKVWWNEYPYELDPNSNEVMITTWDYLQGFTYNKNMHRLDGFLTFPLGSGQTLESIKYKITNDTLMIFINTKNIPTSCDNCFEDIEKSAMTVFLMIEDNNIDNIIEPGIVPPQKFKKPVRVFINGKEAKVINGESVNNRITIQ